MCNFVGSALSMAGEMASEVDGDMTNEMAGESASAQIGEVAETDTEIPPENFEATEIGVERDEAVIHSMNGWGTSAYLQVNWMDVDYEILPISEDRVLEMLVEGIIDIAVSIENWMDRNYSE